MNQEDVKLILVLKNVLDEYFFNNNKKLKHLENYLDNLHSPTIEALVDSMLHPDVIDLSVVQHLYYEKTRVMLNPITLKATVKEILTYWLKYTVYTKDPQGMYGTYEEWFVSSELPNEPEDEE